MNFPYLTGEVGKLGIARIKRRIIVGNSALVYDSFLAPDGTLLTAHIPDICPAGNWIHYSGTEPTIQSNKLLASYGGSEDVIESNIANGTISAIQDYNANVNCTNGIIARFENINQYWLLRHYAGALEIIEKNTSFTLRASVGYAPANGVETLIVSLVGNILTLTVSGHSVTYTSASYNTATKHGQRIGSYSFGGILITSDNFTVMP